jgi:predicted ATPase with chaperone activity
VGLPLPTEPAMMTALLAVEQEAMQLEAAMTSCDLACRALGSLERAARVVCDLEQGDERPRCEMARSRLRGARARVRAACGQCSGGPTTDPDAPMGP